MNNIEQGVHPLEVAQAVKRHQLMMEGFLMRIDPPAETTKGCPSAFSLRALVRDALLHYQATQAIEEEWRLKEQPNF